MKTLILGALVAMTVSAPSWAQTATQRFDLVCSGVEKPFGSGEAKPENRRYTLDLAAKRWCRTTECKEGLEISRVTADDITLSKSLPDQGLKIDHSISRVTGQFSERVWMDITSTGWSTTGSCTRAPFSGFPKAKF